MMMEEKERKIHADPETDKSSAEVFQRISQMTMSEKIKLASFGNKEVRRILIRDPVKSVQVAVLNNPKITDSEIEQIASSKSVDNEVLRLIQMNREWMKKYPIKLALIKNPKTSIQVALRMLNHLRKKDLKDLTGNRNIPNSLREAAKRLYGERSA